MPNKNPLLLAFNAIVDFSQITTKHIEQAVAQAIEETNNHLEAIIQVKSDERTFENTMQTYDMMTYRLNQVYGCVYILMSASPSESIRNTSMQQVQKIGFFANQIALNKSLYEAIKTYSTTNDARQRTGTHKKFIDETVRHFEKNGFALSPEKRIQLQTLQDEMTKLGNHFHKNINEYYDFLEVSEEEMQGLPEDFKKAHWKENGMYHISIHYPSYYPFMSLSESSSARKKLYYKFLNRAADKNLDILNQILKLRHKKAKLLGFETYSTYKTDDLMSKDAETVWNFLSDLRQKIRPKAQEDYARLLKLKRQKDHPEATELYSWESSYYLELLKKEAYNVDAEEVKKYFELNAVLNGMFEITEQLFGVNITEIQNPSVWHEDVRLFELSEKNAVIGRFYLDLFPREGKYQHAACFPMFSGCATKAGYQKPLLSLVCNFPRPTETSPSLLKHRDVETMFHEFGHGLHTLLTQSALASYSGTSTVRDFVEVPSQLFENWAWDYDILAKFAKHVDTGEVIPRELHKNMEHAQKVGAGLHYLQQIFYGMYDLTLHDRFDPEGGKTTTDVFKELYNQVTLYDYLEGTHFEAGFGHLNGYASSYYGYLWALVYACDIFSVFKREGIMNTELGKKYRTEILEKGGSIDENQQLNNFLGRTPNSKAFMESLNL